MLIWPFTFFRFETLEDETEKGRSLIDLTETPQGRIIAPHVTMAYY
jgi:hypothetical protein